MATWGKEEGQNVGKGEDVIYGWPLLRLCAGRLFRGDDVSIETCAREQKSEDTYIRPYCVEVRRRVRRTRRPAAASCIKHQAAQL